MAADCVTRYLTRRKDEERRRLGLQDSLGFRYDEMEETRAGHVGFMRARPLVIYKKIVF